MNAHSTSDPAAQPNPVTVERTSDRELVVTRTFNAPARLVFDAWTKPELFRKWWVPQSMGMTLHSLDMDARTGGSSPARSPRSIFGPAAATASTSATAWCSSARIST